MSAGGVEPLAVNGDQIAATAGCFMENAGRFTENAGRFTVNRAAFTETRGWFTWAYADTLSFLSPDMIRHEITFSSISRRRLAIRRQRSWRNSMAASGSMERTSCTVD